MNADPQRGPFTGRSEVDEYLSHDEIACLICGRRFRTLARHVRITHNLSCDQYRKMFAIPAGCGLVCAPLRKQAADQTRQRHLSGKLSPDLLAASQAARQAGRGERVAWELLEQSRRAAAIEREIIPDGGLRRDGRDAVRARETQRRRRAAVKSRE
ncbi:hypothetical protein GVI59_18320 [Acetobacter sicerae]|nr:hypothetical protein [Acetobacter sicerae]